MTSGSPLNEMDGVKVDEHGPSAQVPALPGGVTQEDGSQPTNGDIMARLDKMMSNMVIKQDLNELRNDITKETKVTISEAVDPIKSEMADVKVDFAKFDAGLRTARATAVDAKASVEALRTEFEQRVASISETLARS